MSNVVSANKSVTKQSSDSFHSTHHHHHHHHYKTSQQQLIIKRDNHNQDYSTHSQHNQNHFANNGHNHPQDFKRSVAVATGRGADGNASREFNGRIYQGQNTLEDPCDRMLFASLNPVIVGASTASALNQSCQCATSSTSTNCSSTTPGLSNQVFKYNKYNSNHSTASEPGPILGTPVTKYNIKKNINDKCNRKVSIVQQAEHRLAIASHQAPNPCNKNKHPPSGLGEPQVQVVVVEPAPDRGNEEVHDDDGADEDFSDTDELNFGYEPVLTKILNEKKLALSNSPDVFKFLSSFQQKIEHNNIGLND